MARATSSLPLPLSPSISTGKGDCAARATRVRSCPHGLAVADQFRNLGASVVACWRARREACTAGAMAAAATVIRPSASVKRTGISADQRHLSAPMTDPP